MRKHRSLRWRLVRTYIMLIVLVLVLFVLWVGPVLQNTRVKHRKQELEIAALFVARILEDQVVYEWSTDQDLSLQTVAASLVRDVKRRLLIVDEHGHVLADSQGELAPFVQTNDAEIAAILADSDSLYVTVPIRQGTRKLGIVYLAMPKSELRARIYRQWLLLVGPGVLVALATGAVSLWLAGRLLEPVRALTRTAQEMAGGALDRRIAIDTEDELGAMGRAFNQMADRVTDMLSQQRTFVTNASHELRTPLTSIQLWIEALLGGAKDDPEMATHSLNEIAKQTERLSHMVEQLLNLSRLESGLVSTELIPTAVPEFIRGVVAELEPQFEQKNHAVQHNIDT